MALFEYDKYKISVGSDSKKTQGLKVGDIVRRQYFDGSNQIYTLMCVLEVGKELNGSKDSSYFIGALLEGSPPQTQELLDFVRVTNMHDCDRSGALYLTASDSEAPFMDVIDEVAKNASLSYPEKVEFGTNVDSASSYSLSGSGFSYEFTENTNGVGRVLKIVRDATTFKVFRLRQKSTVYLKSGELIAVSFKARSTQDLQLSVSFGDSADAVAYGSTDIQLSADWKYYFLCFTINDTSRRERELKIESVSSQPWTIVEFGDFNIVPVSAISHFATSSMIRIGKLNGVSDSVFGELNGYGLYAQQIYASKAVNVSGTITAGDENGFGSTFYAGRIHRNAFINSLSPMSEGEISMADDVTPPTGVGLVVRVVGETKFIAQSLQWANEHLDEVMTMSLWVRSDVSQSIDVMVGNVSAGAIVVLEEEVGRWKRVSFTVRCSVDNDANNYIISLSPESDVLISSIQLERGRYATQYQPTDDVLDFSNEYGMWANRGGFGGTIQNPLLKLNIDGVGGLGTASGSFLLRHNGSGRLANGNIQWDKDGNVSFGDNVKLSWGNLSDSAKVAMGSRVLNIIGLDTFVCSESLSGAVVSSYPSIIQLKAELSGSTNETIEYSWFYRDGNEFVKNHIWASQSILVSPDGDYWRGSDILLIKCVAKIGVLEYLSTITIKKTHASGYSVEIISSHGESFKNGQVQTTLTARLMYNGSEIVSPEELSQFNFYWRKFETQDMSQEDTSWWQSHISIDRTARSILISEITGDIDLFVCEVSLNEASAAKGFPYAIPINL